MHPASMSGSCHSLDEIKLSFRRLYPAGDWSGEIRADQIVDTSRSYQGSKDAVLFSGGVDSVTSVVLHKEKKPRLVTVWGADLGLAQHRLWDQVSAANRTFTRNKSVEIRSSKRTSELFSIRIGSTRSHRNASRTGIRGFNKDWVLWDSVLRSLTWMELGTIYIPSTHTADFGRACLTRPMEIAATLNPVTYVMESMRSLVLEDLELELDLARVRGRLRGRHADDRARRTADPALRLNSSTASSTGGSARMSPAMRSAASR